MSLIKFLFALIIGGVITTTGIYAYQSYTKKPIDFLQPTPSITTTTNQKVENPNKNQISNEPKKHDNSNQAIASPGLNADELETINIYKRVSPSVVNIATITYEEDFFFDVVPRQGAGSGFIIDTAGHVLTNNHVVAGAQKMSVSFEDQSKTYPATLVGLDARSDLAVIKVKGPSSILTPVMLGDSSILQVGQKAIAIGNPFGIGRTITTGVISALNRKVRKSNNSVASDMIQTDAAINMGNSGGPLINSKGEVIGINTMIFSPNEGKGSVGIGFAIPINNAKRFLPDLIQKGKVSYPWLGVKILALRPDYKEVLELPVYEGLLVLQVIQNSPASYGGIKGGNKRVIVGNVVLPLGGDIITAIDGVKLYKETDLTNYLESKKKIGETANVTVVRGNKILNIPVKLFEKPQR